MEEDIDTKVVMKSQLEVGSERPISSSYFSGSEGTSCPLSSNVKGSPERLGILPLLLIGASWGWSHYCLLLIVYLKFFGGIIKEWWQKFVFSLTGWTKSYNFLFCSISWPSELLSSSTDPLSEVPPTLTLLFIDNFYHIRFTHWHYKVWGLGIKLYNNWLYSLHVMYFRFIHVMTSLQRRISFLILSSHLWHTSSLIFSLTYFNNILLFFQKHNIFCFYITLCIIIFLLFCIL